MHKIDLTLREVDPPHDRLCKSGHQAPEFFRREGPETVALPTRFFHVTVGEVNGTYCEPCLIIANWLEKQLRDRKEK